MLAPAPPPPQRHLPVIVRLAHTAVVVGTCGPLLVTTQTAARFCRPSKVCNPSLNAPMCSVYGQSATHSVQSLGRPEGNTQAQGLPCTPPLSKPFSQPSPQPNTQLPHPPHPPVVVGLAHTAVVVGTSGPLLVSAQTATRLCHPSENKTSHSSAEMPTLFYVCLWTVSGTNIADSPGQMIASAPPLPSAYQ
jgi:hypothetical protein